MRVGKQTGTELAYTVDGADGYREVPNLLRSSTLGLSTKIFMSIHNVCLAHLSPGVKRGQYGKASANLFSDCYHSNPDSWTRSATNPQTSLPTTRTHI
jgi:hypothetical protein